MTVERTPARAAAVAGASVSDACRVLLLSDDPDLSAAVGRVALAAGVTLDICRGGEMGAAWRRADLVLVGADALETTVDLDPVRRAGVIVVTMTPPVEQVWRDAVSLGVEEVISLPKHDQWLVDRLGEHPSGSMGAGTVVGVIGASGGLGASLLAAGLAMSAAWTMPGPPVLVDLDRLGGGIDLLLGAADVGGLRWGDLTGVEGRVSGTSLRESVLCVDGVSVVTFGRDSASAEPEPRTVRSVVNGARDGAGLVVLDIPRAGGAHVPAVALLDSLIVVVRADVRSCVAARNAVAEFSAQVSDVRLAVRRPHRGALPDRLLGEIFGDLPIYHLPDVRRVGRRIGGGGPALHQRDSFIDACQLVIEDLPIAVGDAQRAA